MATPVPPCRAGPPRPGGWQDRPTARRSNPARAMRANLTAPRGQARAREPSGRVEKPPGAGTFPPGREPIAWAQLYYQLQSWLPSTLLAILPNLAPSAVLASLTARATS